MKPAKQILRITDTTLRDGHQSLWATRMRTDDIMNIIDVIDNVGYYSLEVWGGATFDVCIRFLYEDPWERLRLIKSKAVNTPLQMLLRGQNIVGYKNYPDDLVERFVALAHENGVDIFRVFDALNDTRNLEAAFKAIKKYGAHAQGTLSYTISPVHTIENYVQHAKEQVELGIDSLCIKDMAGLLSPVMTKNLVTALRREIDVPIQLHCHATSGMASSAYFEGVIAGAGAIDCAISPLAGFSSQPPVESLLAMFRETEFDVNLDIEALRKVNKYFTELNPRRSKGRGHEPIIDSEILVHQIPGGMISNFRSQLEQQDAIEKLPEALEEVARVRKDLGYPPLVTPTSQIVGTQAVMNVLAGERYKMVPQEVKNYVKGMYGRWPAPIDPKLIKKILGDDKPIDHRPADDLKPILPTATQGISNPELIHNEEDIITYCLFPDVAMEFFKWRAMPESMRPKSPAEIEGEAFGKGPDSSVKETEKASEPLKPLVSPEDYAGFNALIEKASALNISELVISKGDISLMVWSGDGGAGKKNRSVKPIVKPSGQSVEETDKGTEELKPQFETIDAIMAGTFYRAASQGSPPFVEGGSVVKKGDAICILEAMKLFNEIQSPVKCKIIEILVENASKVSKGQPLMSIERIS